MDAGISIRAVGVPGEKPAGSHFSRLVALLEVLLAFATVHVLFRAIKRFTAWGRLEGAAHLNFTPGLVMILFTVCVLVLCRRSFRDYGLTLEQWADGLKVGLLWGLLLVSGAGLLAIVGVGHQPGIRPPTMTEGAVYALAVLGAVVLFASLLTWQRTMLSRIPGPAALLVLCGLMCVPLLVAIGNHRPFPHTLLTVLWLIIGAACGEEVFYRGYIQSRINESFGRPFRLGGVQFGVGVLISSLLFGLLHAFNSVDYFEGHFSFAWGFGLAALCTGLLYGLLRETTGSVLASIVTHAVLDVLVIVPGLMGI